VTIAAGAKTATFAITSKTYGSNYNATITAKDSVTTKTTQLIIDIN
jgi:hypothetical protein